MKRLAQTVGSALCLACVGFCCSAQEAEEAMTAVDFATCERLHINVHGDKPIRTVNLPMHNSCSTQKKNGFPVPDPKCTPGAVNPSLTLAVLRTPGFKTGCVRDRAVSEAGKAVTYAWYGMKEPADNSHETQTCELDHLVSLELGGADTLDNIWPQCGPDGVDLRHRFFKEKDTVENFLAWLVRNDRMDLAEAQSGIAADWTQFLDKAQRACPGGQCKDANLPPPR